MIKTERSQRKLRFNDCSLTQVLEFQPRFFLILNMIFLTMWWTKIEISELTQDKTERRRQPRQAAAGNQMTASPVVTVDLLLRWTRGARRSMEQLPAINGGCPAR